MTVYGICNHDRYWEPVFLPVSEQIGRVGIIRWPVIQVIITQPLLHNLYNHYCQFLILLLIVVTVSLFSLFGNSQISVVFFTLQSVCLPFLPMPWSQRSWCGDYQWCCDWWLLTCLAGIIYASYMLFTFQPDSANHLPSTLNRGQQEKLARMGALYPLFKAHLTEWAGWWWDSA